MSAAAVRVTVTAHIGHSATEVIATKVAVVSAIGVPWRWPIFEASACATNDGEGADRLLGLLATLRAWDELEDVGHRHPLFGASPAPWTEVFVKRHA